MTIAKLLNPKLSYDPLRDLTHVSLLGVSALGPDRTCQRTRQYGGRVSCSSARGR